MLFVYTDLFELACNQMTEMRDLEALHAWCLTGDKILATVDIRCENLEQYAHLADDIREICRLEGVHSTAVQPTFTNKVRQLAAIAYIFIYL